MARIDDLLGSAEWARAREASATGPRVLLATSMGGFNHGAVTDKALAIALTLHGAAVDVFLCDGAPACHLTKIGKEPPARLIETDRRIRCPACIDTGQTLFAPLGLRVLRLSEFLTEDDIEQARSLAAGADISQLVDFTLNGWRVGEHARAGALRYFARGDLAREPQSEGVARTFLQAAVRSALAFDRILEQNDYVAVSANHGIYTPQGVIGEVSRKRGVRVVNWNPAYRKHSFVFSHGDSYHRTMITEDVSNWESLDLDGARGPVITDYLRDRREAKGDWIWFNNAGDSSREEIARQLSLDDRPIIVALTSVVWDACLHYDSNAFDSLQDWLFQTVEYFSSRPDLQLVIRVHPAEVTGFVKSRDKAADMLAERFPELPENIHVIRPDDTLSTYSLIDQANAVLVYSTKTGIEASAQGVPVVVAGEAWIRNKGFTQDASSPASYREILDGLPLQGPLPPDQRARAMRYAYHFFFRRMIELPFLVDAGPAEFDIQVDALQDLAPGGQGGLDRICDGIIAGAPFVYDKLEAEPAA